MTVTGDDLTTAAAALQEYYAKNVMMNLIPKDTPFFGMVKKDGKWGGKPKIRIPFLWGNAGGISPNFAIAQANSLLTSQKYDQVEVDRVATYGVGQISRELMLATKGNMPAFIEAVKPTTDGIMINLFRNWEICAFRGGYGVRGQIKSTTTLASTTIILTDKNDSFNFEVGYRLDLTAAVGSTAASKKTASGGDYLVVTGIDNDAGTLTVETATATAISTAALGDYITLAGAITTGRGSPCGLLGWAPDSKPSSGESFFGLDRSVSSRLYGQRYDASTAGASIVEAINKGMGKLRNFGGIPDTTFMSNDVFADFANSLEGKTWYETIHTEVGTVGYDGIKIRTGRGMMDVYGSIACPSDHIWVVDMDHWTLYSLGEAVDRVNEDGFQMLRAPNSDGFEIRYASYGNFGCNNPGAAACNIKIA